MKYRHHKYTWEKPFGSERHTWSFIGPRGGLHFHVSMFEKHQPSCGLEFHWFAPPDHARDDAPSQVPCWLLKVPCWHDGTSLYASETLWPMIEPMLRSGDHETIFRFLEHEADRAFAPKCEEVDDD